MIPVLAVLLNAEGPVCEAGTTLFAATDLEAPSLTDASPVRGIPFGTALTAITRSPDFDGMLGAQCEVRLPDGSTAVFDRLDLAADRWVLDLDADGDDDTMIARFDADDHLVLRVAGGAALDLGVQQDMGGTLRHAEITPAPGPGRPLIRVYVPGSEQCGGFSREIFVAWGRRGGAVVLDGSSGADAPVYGTDTFTFSADATRVTEEHVSGEWMNDGGTSEDITTTTLRWKGSSYRKVREVTRHEDRPAN